jgi:hypothetical protein
MRNIPNVFRVELRRPVPGCSTTAVSFFVKICEFPYDPYLLIANNTIAVQAPVPTL